MSSVMSVIVMFPHTHNKKLNTHKKKRIQKKKKESERERVNVCVVEGVSRGESGGI